jgi:hypothetical protein
MTLGDEYSPLSGIQLADEHFTALKQQLRRPKIGS